MKRFIKPLVTTATLIAIAVGLFASSFHKIVDAPLSNDYVAACFVRDEDDLELIKEYILRSGYEVFYMEEDFTTAVTELKLVTITDQDLLEALERLQDYGYTKIEKTGDTIEFRMWTGVWYGECGIAFVTEETVNQIKHKIQTDILLNEWQYYFSNYRAYEN